MISTKKSIKNLHFSICADLLHHGFINDWRVNLHLFISSSLKSICDDSGAIAYRFDNFQKNIDVRIDRPYAEFQNICNTPSKVTEFSEYLFASILKTIQKKWHFMVSYWMGANSVPMMDQATQQTKRIYASFLSRIDWEKSILVHKSHGKNWINFHNWFWSLNGSATFKLMLCLNVGFRNSDTKKVEACREGISNAQRSLGSSIPSLLESGIP